MKKHIVLLLSSLLALNACATENPAMPAATAVQASQASQAHNAPAEVKRAEGIWIDVRTPEEFQAGHLQDAVNIPHEQIAAQIASVAPDKNAPIHLYCKSSRRAGIALEELKKLGYTNLTNHGGYEDLIKQGIR